MPDQRPVFTVIHGRGQGPKPWRRRSIAKTEQITCYRCEELGVSTSATVRVTVGPRRKPDGTAAGGTEIEACAYCLGRGEVVGLALVVLESPVDQATDCP